MSSKSFKEFIISLLERGNVRPENTEKFTDEDSLQKFRLAFIHKSLEDSVGKNYERFEFMGDSVIGACLARYISQRFPKVESVHWMTNLKHKLASGKSLGLLAEKYGFLQYVKYGESMKMIIAKNPTILDNDEYKGMLEDVFEAFIGATVDVIDTKMSEAKDREIIGAGWAVAYQIIRSFLDEIEIKVESMDVFNPVQMLKETFDSVGWDFPRSVRHIKLGTVEDPRARIEITGYPLNDRKPEPRNAKILAVAEGSSKKEAELAAAKKALDVLDRMYAIRKIPLDKHKKNL